jgi:hypothetical protein
MAPTNAAATEMGLNHSQLEEEETEKADEVYREITEVYKPLGDSKGSKINIGFESQKLLMTLK